MAGPMLGILRQDTTNGRFADNAVVAIPDLNFNSVRFANEVTLSEPEAEVCQNRK